jgi:PAS domain S-box-containing protein
MDGLFHTALKAHASMGVGEVHAAIEDSAKQLLRSDSARFSKDPPGQGELGSPVKSADGQARWLVVSDRRGVEPYDDADRNLLGAIVAIASAALDNAGLHQQTVDERKKLDDVVGSSSDGIFAVDEDGVIDSWNPAMEMITGRDASQMLGTAHLGSLRPRNDSGADVLNDGWVSRREIPPPDIQILTPSGDKRWLSCTYAPMRSGGFVVVARDVTAQKEVEELKADFLATVSHELRTPLTPIQGFIQTLINRGDTIDAKQRKEFYATILRQSSRLSRLVEDLLDATNLQGRQQVFRNKIFDWGDTAAEVLQSFTGEHPDRRFSLEIQENLPPLSADPDRSVQVLSNLLTNATKYSNLESPIRVTIEQQGDNVMTTVADEGPGVRPEDREKIFERFIRLGDHLTREAQGVGLGLFITRRLVEGMNGKIWVGDSPEGGAAFTFSLPVQATTEGPTSGALSQLDDARNESER